MYGEGHAQRTSIEAYRRIEESGLLKALNLAVYKYLCEFGPSTNRQIHTGMSRVSGLARDIGVVSSRTAALVRMDALEVIDERPCETTGETVKVFAVTGRDPVKQKKTRSKRELALIESMLNEIDACARIAELWNAPLIAQAIREERKKSWTL